MTQEHYQHPAREHRWITTYGGHRIDSRNVHPQQISKPDILRGICMQVRYLGQIKDFYSIAEHSVLVSNIARLKGDSILVQQCALLHDGHEYITGDFPSPYKYDVPGLREWEGQIEAVFRDALHLPPNNDPIWQKVKLYDLLALHFEAHHLMVQDSGWIDPVKVMQVPDELTIDCLGWRTARDRFRVRALELGLEGF